MRLIIDELAKLFGELFKQWPGSKSYGLTELVSKSGMLFPSTFDGTYVGYDDVSPIIAYHRSNTVNVAIRPGSHGDELGEIVNTYQNMLFIYFDKNRVKLTTDEVANYIQANMPDFVRMSPYNKITIRTVGIILNSRTVFGEEFQGGDLQLPIEKSMIKISYTVESAFNKRCFKTCAC